MVPRQVVKYMCNWVLHKVWGSCFALGVGIRAFLRMIFDSGGRGIAAIFCLGGFCPLKNSPRGWFGGGGGGEQLEFTNA